MKWPRYPTPGYPCCSSLALPSAAPLPTSRTTAPVSHRDALRRGSSAGPSLVLRQKESSLGKHARQLRKKQRRNIRAFGTAEIIHLQAGMFEEERQLPPIKALNAKQAAYLDALRCCPQVIVLGPAGTGKTWMAATHAADLLRNRQIDRIVLTRPNVPCGRSLGYFPGTLEAKFAPWAMPVIEAIRERIGIAACDIALKHGDIELVPFEVMRGRSWKNAFVLLDEAQNATV